MRRVSALPRCCRFAPARDAMPPVPPVTMTLDEFEAIRLIDLGGLTQEQCAARMGVARATAQAVYGSARAKLAEFLVNGRELAIEGGPYELCGHGSGSVLPTSQTEGNITMKIAATYENGQIYQHFGHTAQFKLYSVENGGISSSGVVDTEGAGHGALAGFLAQRGVDVLVCGGIGGGARQALSAAGIEVFGGVSGEADSAVAALVAGTLAFDPNATCSHHAGHEGGGCAGHSGCGEHTCEG
jgi:predicted DNA-binding protein (UPF0251 family)/predicted Fe-Mo cluster-binding NifX family protein